MCANDGRSDESICGADGTEEKSKGQDGNNKMRLEICGGFNWIQTNHKRLLCVCVCVCVPVQACSDICLLARRELCRNPPPPRHRCCRAAPHPPSFRLLSPQPSITGPHHHSSLMMMKLWTRQRSQRGIGFAVHARVRAHMCSNGSGVKQRVYASAGKAG